MTAENPGQPDVDAFIRRDIDSVPHLEALLLLWRQTPVVHTVEEMAHYLYVDRERAAVILRDLDRLGLIAAQGEAGYRYATGLAERDALLTELDRTYRSDLIRITRIIHAKGSQSARAFARAFRFAKEEERK
jgi:hypothetical protein